MTVDENRGGSSNNKKSAGRNTCTAPGITRRTLLKRRGIWVNSMQVHVKGPDDIDVNISAIWTNACLEKSIMYNITHLPGLFSSLIMRYAFQGS